MLETNIPVVEEQFEWKFIFALYAQSVIFPGNKLIVIMGQLSSLKMFEAMDFLPNLQ